MVIPKNIAIGAVVLAVLAGSLFVFLGSDERSVVVTDDGKLENNFETSKEEKTEEPSGQKTVPPPYVTPKPTNTPTPLPAPVPLQYQSPAANTPNSSGSGANSQAAGQVTELRISPAVVSDIVLESAQIPFHADAVFTDGTSRDMTSSVEWRIVGNIGSISPSGVFTAQMSVEDSESPSAAGFVQALIVQGGVTLESNATLIMVEHLIVDDGNTDG